MRVAECGELFHPLEVMQQTFFRHIIMGDESWFYLEYQHASQWSVFRDEVLRRVDLVIGIVQFILTAIWGVKGFHLRDLMLSQCRLNAQYFVEYVMALLAQTVFPKGRTRYTPRPNVHLDNCHVHFSKVTEQFSIDNQLLHVPHPPYSPGLAPSDFWLFGRIKTRLDGRSFAKPEELLERIREFLEGISATELTVVFEGSIDRVR
jgi:hypothetical protein